MGHDSIGWWSVAAAVVVVMVLRGLWFAVDFGRWYRRRRRHTAERLREIDAARGRLPAALKVGAFTFDRHRLLGALVHQEAATGWLDDRAIDVLLDREPAGTAWVLLDAPEPMHHRAPLGGRVRNAGRYLLSFECPQCGSHRPRDLQVLHVVRTGGGAGTVHVSCPNWHPLEQGSWIS